MSASTSVTWTTTVHTRNPNAYVPTYARRGSRNDTSPLEGRASVQSNNSTYQPNPRVQWPSISQKITIRSNNHSRRQSVDQTVTVEADDFKTASIEQRIVVEVPRSIFMQRVSQEMEEAEKDPTVFLRELEEMPVVRTRDPRYKTSYCHAIVSDLDCSYNNKCQYAHSFREKYRYNIEQEPLYKTRTCKHLIVEDCNYGEKCKSGHIGDLMRIVEKVQTASGMQNVCIGVFILREKPAKKPEAPPSSPNLSASDQFDRLLISVMTHIDVL